MRISRHTLLCECSGTRVAEAQSAPVQPTPPKRFCLHTLGLDLRCGRKRVPEDMDSEPLLVRGPGRKKKAGDCYSKQCDETSPDGARAQMDGLLHQLSLRPGSEPGKRRRLNGKQSI